MITSARKVLKTNVSNFVMHDVVPPVITLKHVQSLVA